MGLYHRFLDQPKSVLFIEFLLVTIFIALGDCATGYEVSFGLFYTLPLIFTVWYCGRWPGLALGIFTMALRHAVDVITKHPYSHYWIHVWNDGIRVGYMLLIWHGAAITRIKLDRERSQVKTLQGILPICTNCKRIRGKDGYWTEIDSYLRLNSLAEPSAKLCPECSLRHFTEQMRPAT